MIERVCVPARARRGLLALLVGAPLVLAACSGRNANSKGQAGGADQAVPVTVATVVRKSIPVQVQAIGSVEAYSTVSVKSQVAGKISKVHFKEGQDVRKGEILFTIDPRSFQAQLRQAEADLKRDEAQANHARVEANRYADLVRQGIVAREQYDTFRTNADALEATVAADRAAVADAKVRLTYCFIRSPIDGRTGSLLVHAGNVVKDNETNLVVINQVKPILVDFSVPQERLPEIQEHLARGPLEVTAVPSGEDGDGEQGTLRFVDNAVNSTTGTILLKGRFANASRRLWPGQFVNVTLTLATQANALVVPSEAVQTGQQGDYVFVVGANDRAEVRPVTAREAIHGWTVIEKGLRIGDRVVTDGQLRLAPGVPVMVEAASGAKGRAGQ